MGELGLFFTPDKSLKVWNYSRQSNSEVMFNVKRVSTRFTGYYRPLLLRSMNDTSFPRQRPTTHWKRVCDPLLGRDPLVENHCSSRPWNKILDLRHWGPHLEDRKFCVWKHCPSGVSTAKIRRCFSFWLVHSLLFNWRCKAVVLNWWVGTQKWVADPFSVGHGPLPGGETLKNPQKRECHSYSLTIGGENSL